MGQYKKYNTCIIGIPEGEERKEQKKHWKQILWVVLVWVYWSQTHAFFASYITLTLGCHAKLFPKVYFTNVQSHQTYASSDWPTSSPTPVFFSLLNDILFGGCVMVLIAIFLYICLIARSWTLSMYRPFDVILWRVCSRLCLLFYCLSLAY